MGGPQEAAPGTLRTLDDAGDRDAEDHEGEGRDEDEHDHLSDPPLMPDVM
jgi:hypothetical protein